MALLSRMARRGSSKRRGSKKRGGRGRHATRKTRGARSRQRRQRGGAPQGSAGLLDGYFSYPVTGKIPSMKIEDVDSIPTVMGKDDYEELKDEL